MFVVHLREYIFERSICKNQPRKIQTLRKDSEVGLLVSGLDMIGEWINYKYVGTIQWHYLLCQKCLCLKPSTFQNPPKSKI